MAFYATPLDTNSSRWSVYDRPNGERVFIDLQYPLDRWCNVSIEADTDIAGPGVALAFIVPAVLTIFFAFIRALMLAINLWSSQQATTTTARPTRDSWKRPSDIIEMSDTLLSALCGLQAFTALGIIAAGFAQGSDLSFYHSELVLQYCFMVLNSFWGAQRKSMPMNSNALTTRLRKLLILTAMLTATAFNIRELYRQPKHWDFLDGRRCYLYKTIPGYDDSGRNLFWWSEIVGMLIYAAAMCSSFNASFEIWISEKEKAVNTWTSAHWVEAITHAKLLDPRAFGRQAYPTRGRPMTWSLALHAITIASGHAFLAATSFVLHQVVAYWSYADGFELMQVLLYIISIYRQIRNFVMLKHLNYALLVGDESSWRFGQWLPMIMLLSLLFSLMERFREKHLKMD